MTLREEILKEHSKAHSIRLARKIEANQEDFDGLMELFFGTEYRVTQRAAWIVSQCAEVHPWLLEKHLKSMIENLQRPVHDAVKRNTLRILQFMELPEDLLGITAEICFQFLNSGFEPVAIKVFSMTVLFNIVRKYPELKEELKISIEDQLPYGSAGFKSRGQKTLKALEKI